MQFRAFSCCYPFSMIYFVVVGIIEAYLRFSNSNIPFECIFLQFSFLSRKIFFMIGSYFKKWKQTFFVYVRFDVTILKLIPCLWSFYKWNKSLLCIAMDSATNTSSKSPPLLFSPLLLPISRSLYLILPIDGYLKHWLEIGM